MKKIMRPSKFGGVSPCSSPDDKVGRGRCHHILEHGDRVCLEWDKESESYNLDLSGKFDGEDRIKVDMETVNKFIDEINNSVDDETKDKIIKKMHKMR